MDITLHGNVAEIVQEQMIKGGYQSPDDVVYEAIELLIKQKLNNYRLKTVGYFAD